MQTAEETLSSDLKICLFTSVFKHVKHPCDVLKGCFAKNQMHIKYVPLFGLCCERCYI